MPGLLSCFLLDQDLVPVASVQLEGLFVKIVQQGFLKPLLACDCVSPGVWVFWLLLERGLLTKSTSDARIESTCEGFESRDLRGQTDVLRSS